jgi:hypothetical protein
VQSVAGWGGHEIFAQKYRLLEPLEVGSDTVRFLAEHLRIHRHVELETLAPGVPTRGASPDRLLRRARVMGCVSHAGIQSVVDSGIDEHGRPYVVCEALRGVTLAELLETHPRGLPPGRAVRIALSVLEAIRAFHQAGVVVRGLGPENVVVLVDRQGHDLVKLRRLEHAAFLAEPPPGYPVPPGPWIAPELRRGRTGLDPSVDLYSVGVMLRHLCTGQAEAGRPLPDAIGRVVERATREAAEERSPDADRLIEAVSSLLATDRRSRPEEMQSSDDPLASNLRNLALRRNTEHVRTHSTVGQGKVHLLPLLLTIEAIYRRLGRARWQTLAEVVPEVDDLLPASGHIAIHLANGVPFALFGRIVATADALAGRGEFAFLPELGEATAQRGLRRLIPELPMAPTPEDIVDRFSTLWSRIAMQGRGHILERSPTAARLAVHGQIDPTLELSGFFAGFLRAAVRQTGAREVAVFLTSCQAVGDAADVYRVTWER